MKSDLECECAYGLPKGMKIGPRIGNRCVGADASTAPTPDGAVRATQLSIFKRTQRKIPAGSNQQHGCRLPI
jgi:hypothetical protein